MEITPPQQAPSPEDIEVGKTAEVQLLAMHFGALLLRSLKREDALNAGIYALELIADVKAPENGPPLQPMLQVLQSVYGQLLDTLQDVPDEALELSDEGAWAEGFLGAVALHAPGAPAAAGAVAEVMIYYLSGLNDQGDPLMLGTLADVPEPVQKMARHLMVAYRKLMQRQLKALGIAPAPTAG